MNLGGILLTGIGLIPAAPALVSLLGLGIGLAGVILTYQLYKNGQATIDEVILSSLSTIPLVSGSKFIASTMKTGKFSADLYKSYRLDGVIGGQISLYSLTLTKKE